ncbi:hypothetical protein D6810_03080, partial [Candidatus Dojkabacteria bacterium]
METVQTLLIIASVINVSLAFVVFIAYLQTKKNFLISFSIFVLNLFIWVITMYNFRLSNTVDEAKIWAKLLYTSASFIPFFFLLFVQNFSKLQTHKLKVILLFCSISSTTFALLSLFGDLIESVVLDDTKEKVINFGNSY